MVFGYFRFSIFFLFVFNLWFVSPVKAASETQRIPVFVSIPPQRYFVEKIGGIHVRVTEMLPPGANPHTYEPKPKQIASLSKAAIYFAAGVPYESVWLKKFQSANPRMRIVNTDAGIEKIPISHHDHGEKENGLDPHTWLSPPLVKIHAQHIAKGLIEIDPSKKNFYTAGLNSLLIEIDALDSDLHILFSGKGEKLRFMVFHPAWGYFAKTYGLTQIPVEVEGKEPKPAELENLIRLARKEQIKMIFVQPQFSIKSAEVIAQNIGGIISYADPMAFHWEANLREVGKKFGQALR
ncbi:MAG: zinc ABC transporter substrate-binding protein [Thermodesulfobacteriota bacterium]